MLGPTRNTKSIRPIARTMFSSDRFFTPLSRPATTEQIAKHATAKEVAEGFNDVLDIVELVNPVNARVAVAVIDRLEKIDIEKKTGENRLVTLCPSNLFVQTRRQIGAVVPPCQQVRGTAAK